MKKSIVVSLFCIALVLTFCLKNTGAVKPFDDHNRVIARYGTPIIDGTIDEVWETAGKILPELKSSADILASGEFRVLWDESALYSLFIVTDPVLNDTNINTYEQDSVEVFLDEENDKAISYQSDDVHYRVNFKNVQSTDAGAPHRFSSATSLLKDDDGNIIGYIVETSLLWSKMPESGTIIGFELQINDADATGRRLGTINIFDQDGTAWSNPSSMGEIILIDENKQVASARYTGMLYSWIKYVESINPNAYINSKIIIEPLKNAKAVLQNPTATQNEIDAAEAELREVVANLTDGSGFLKVQDLVENKELTDAFTFFNGEPVNSTADWHKRAEEIRRLYQYYMYGVMPDSSNETISYTISGNEMQIAVKKDNQSVSFPVMFQVPDADKVAMPEGGYPVLIAFGWLGQTDYANNRGYAIITLNTEVIAADNLTRAGVFYELYPYGDFWTEQTGALMAWSWGVSKILDSLETGAGAELNINPEYSIVTGVSRWGKAAAVAGAFDKRIKVTVPACSGAGGMASFRYTSEGKVYDYSTLGLSNPYTMSANEPLGSLQSSGERHWFNDNFLKFKQAAVLPFDQHLLAALCADEPRYLFITGSYLYEDWTNPPGMWVTYLAAKEVFDFLELNDHIAILLHKQGHMVTDEDMIYLLDFCDHHFYGKDVESDLTALTKSLYLEPANYDPFFDRYLK